MVLIAFLKYGDRLSLVGNVFMSDLVLKAANDITERVRWLIEHTGRGGGYIFSSSNSQTDDMKPENVLAIRDAIIRPPPGGEYGRQGRPRVCPLF